MAGEHLDCAWSPPSEVSAAKRRFCEHHGFETVGGEFFKKFKKMIHFIDWQIVMRLKKPFIVCFLF